MNPFFENRMFGFIPGCETCGEKPCNSCDKCHKEPCACPEPFLGVDWLGAEKGSGAVYRFNDNGKTVKVDFGPAIKAAQTDTSLVSDIVDRLLRFSAERHTDTITAQELGAILHLNDLGDVSTKGAENGSTMVYKKTDICGDGCVGTGNVWEPWNALESQARSVAYGYGFDANGNPLSIQQPANPNQYYNLGWNGNNQLSYAQPVESAPRLDSQGYAYQLYVDPATLQTYFVKVKP